MARARPNRTRSTDDPVIQPESDAGARAAADAFKISLPIREGEPPFEGPLDLLLHLV
jgi:hypothetical protein